VSSATLHRIFKHQLGHSPDAHFHGMKMSIARTRLANGQSVKAVAYELGYRHAGDFSRAYMRHFGHSPTVEKS
jgi:AraC-like DNA-binding protein